MTFEYCIRVFHDRAQMNPKTVFLRPTELVLCFVPFLPHFCYHERRLYCIWLAVSFRFAIEHLCLTEQLIASQVDRGQNQLGLYNPMSLCICNCREYAESRRTILYCHRRYWKRNCQRATLPSYRSVVFGLLAGLQGQSGERGRENDRWLYFSGTRRKEGEGGKETGSEPSCSEFGAGKLGFLKGHDVSVIRVDELQHTAHEIFLIDVVVVARSRRAKGV
ncbi:hypothetical protein BS47DRAFT_1101245 [Hydnum rufescens UP504]|uniref:Uncharacterized protein n=1 Tax=Hydnum rufescens UP504 TaxID=1448309 RepID=A0A9P6DVY8_9AGAM|nr:hypothetical protein BS47DRAFT_1101245 [Hydnum rufescens UP504]